VGIVDTAGRAFLPELLTLALPGAVAAQLGPALAAIAIYLLMAAVLSFRPQGLFPAR
jgi:branched-chain amino acid transport system permease protein